MDFNKWSIIRFERVCQFVRPLYAPDMHVSGECEW